MIRVFRVLAGCLVLCAMQAQAGTLVSFATGVNNGSLVADGQQDPNFLLVSGPSGATCSGSALPCHALVVNQTAVDPWFYTGSNGWQADSTSSKWIGPSANQTAANFPGGYYQYKYTLDLTSFGLSGAQLSSLELSIDNWWTDNTADYVQVNGTKFFTNTLPPYCGGTPAPCFVGPTKMLIPAGAVTYNSTTTDIIFDVFNGDGNGFTGPTAFRVEASVALVPEPAAIGIMAAGLLGLLALSRRRKR